MKDILFVVREREVDHLGIMYIGSFLKQYGCSFDVVEAKYSYVAQKMKEDAFKIIAYTASSESVNGYLKFNKLLKTKFNFFSLFGGPCPTFVPELIEVDGVDLICRGEGEEATLELIDNLKRAKPIIAIKNLWVKTNGYIYKNDMRPFIENLDELPFPDRSGFYQDISFERSYKAHVATSRGCQYACSYCYANSVYANYFRYRSVDNVIKELVEIKQMGYKFVIFEDSTLTFSLDWLHDFSEKYKKKINLPFSCNARVEQITEETIDCLKNAGCFTVTMGVEIADDRLRKDMLYRPMSKVQIRNAVELFKRKRINVKLTNVLGLPGTDINYDIETLKFNIECRPRYAKGVPIFFYSKAHFDNFMKTNLHVVNDIYRNKTDTLERRHETVCLFYLFDIFVQFPILLFLIKPMLKLPLKNLYYIIFCIWGGYSSHYKLYPTGWKGVMNGFRRYWKLLSMGMCPVIPLCEEHNVKP